jgi:hypothetical protein
MFLCYTGAALLSRANLGFFLTLCPLFFHSLLALFKYICYFNYNKSIPNHGFFNLAPLAQLAEQQPFKLMVAGSIPARRTKATVNN